MNWSKNVIEQTWLAYAFTGEVEMERIRAGLDRVEEHYQALIDEHLRALRRAACEQASQSASTAP